MKKLKNLMAGFWRLAGPGAVMMLIEAWSFELSTLLAGYLGTVALDAHLTMLQLATLSFLSLPFAVAIASTTVSQHGKSSWYQRNVVYLQ